MKFQDRNEFEVYLSGLAGIAGLVAQAAYRTHLRSID